MNAEISYEYADASNFKQRKTVVVAGGFTAADIARFEELLEEGMFFIPGDLDLPELQTAFDDVTDDDHIWHMITPAEDIRLTDKPVTVSITWAEIAGRLDQMTSWDERAADIRLEEKRLQEMV